MLASVLQPFARSVSHSHALPLRKHFVSDSKFMRCINSSIEVTRIEKAVINRILWIAEDNGSTKS